MASGPALTGAASAQASLPSDAANGVNNPGGVESDVPAREQAPDCMCRSAIPEIDEGVCEAMYTNGDTFLGGEDFSNRIVDYFVDEFRKESGMILRKDRLALQRLNDAAKKAKIELSRSSTRWVEKPAIQASAITAASVFSADFLEFGKPGR